jgi:hypothetical protein
MNRQQKVTLIKFITVILVTAIAVTAMINIKDWVNRSEAMRAMEHLGQKILEYRKAYRSVPPESFVTNIKESLEGYVRLGNVQYRGIWIDPESTPEEILAYAEKKYPSSLLDDGFVVLRLSGQVEWLGTKQFRKVLAQQQSQKEIEMLQRQIGGS